MSQFTIVRIFLFIFALAQCSVAGAEEPGPGGNRFWVVLASRPDADHAVAAALRYHRLKPKVVRWADGSFAAVAGPYAVEPGTDRTFLDKLIDEPSVPKDAYLTKDSSFGETVWTTPATNILDTADYDGEHDVTLRADGLEIKLTRRPAGENEFAPVAIGTFKGNQVFQMEFTENPNETPASQVRLMKLDPASPMPQVVFTYFWRGAHCCTMTKIVSLSKAGTWHVIDGDTLDGDGYFFEDILGSGFSYLISYDNAFLYAFNSYAGSLAPLRIHRLVGDRLVDVTKEPKFQKRLLQELYSDEEHAKENGDDWHSNGFLAGWVANSLLTGRGNAAWTKMLANYDRNSDFGPEKCTSNLPLDKCPEDKRIKLAFPFALRQFLAEHSYIGDISQFNVPYEVEPASPAQ